VKLHSNHSQPRKSLPTESSNGKTGMHTGPVKDMLISRLSRHFRLPGAVSIY
jgi:hypothetical protein